MEVEVGYGGRSRLEDGGRGRGRGRWSKSTGGWRSTSVVEVEGYGGLSPEWEESQQREAIAAGFANMFEYWKHQHETNPSMGKIIFETYNECLSRMDLKGAVNTFATSVPNLNSNLILREAALLPLDMVAHQRGVSFQAADQALLSPLKVDRAGWSQAMADRPPAKKSNLDPSPR